MKAVITQNIKKYDVSVKTLTKKINVTIVNQKKEYSVVISPLGKRGFTGKSAYELAVDNGFPGTEPEWLDSLKNTYTDLPLEVTQDNQTVFNIFQEPIKSNLFINDLIYFENKDYNIQFIDNAWKLIWLNAFPLKTSDFLVFRK